ncbi:MAG: PASTA domain-containing protein, partial [Candidatus Hydrogenedens sp.]
MWFRGTLEGSAGSDKWIAIVADEVTNVAGFEFVLNYDSDFAEVKQVKPVNAANIWRWNYEVVNSGSSSSLRISAGGEEELGTSGEVELVKVKFKIKRDGKGDIKFVQVQIHDKYGHTPRFEDPLNPVIGEPEPGVVEGIVEGEGSFEGTTEGSIEGSSEGLFEGEGMSEGEGAIETTIVPYMIGLPQQEATGEISNANLNIGAIIEMCNDQYPAGTVVEQIPGGGNTVEIGTIVDLIISCGPCTIVPNVIGMSLEEAQQLIVDYGLLLGQIVEVCDNNYPAGYIALQEPMAVEGTCNYENTIEIPVDIWVSTGPCEEGTPEGVTEGTIEGVIEGIPEGPMDGNVEGIPEGVIEGIPEGTIEGTTEGTFEGEYAGVRGQVINSISKSPIPGVLVQISVADSKGNEPVLTDNNGRFAFPDLGTLQPPYRLDFTKRKYKPKTIQPVDTNAELLVELDPGNIQKSFRPRPYSGPHSVRVAWDTNPEYNIAGYNVYRRTVDRDGNSLTDWQRLNNPDRLPYEGYLTTLEYIDNAVELGIYYQYAIQAVSDVDRYTVLSDASETVRGQYLTVFFPEQVNITDTSLYWLQPNPQNLDEILIRIPVNSKSVYDVSATSIQIDSELPSALISDPETITVLPSGITSGMMIASLAIPQGETINVRIAAAGIKAESLYGAGTLFNIIAKP